MFASLFSNLHELSLWALPPSSLSVQCWGLCSGFLFVFSLRVALCLPSQRSDKGCVLTLQARKAALELCVGRRAHSKLGCPGFGFLLCFLLWLVYMCSASRSARSVWTCEQPQPGTCFSLPWLQSQTSDALTVPTDHLKGHHFHWKHPWEWLSPTPQIQGAPFSLAGKLLAFDVCPALLELYISRGWWVMGMEAAPGKNATDSYSWDPMFSRFSSINVSQIVLCFWSISRVLKMVDFVSFVQLYRRFEGRGFAHLLIRLLLEFIIDHGTYRQ